MTPELTDDFRGRSAFWDYTDLLIFIGFAFPSLVASALLARGLTFVLPVSRVFDALLMQLVWYALIFGALVVQLRVRYDRPFWSSLGWKIPFRGMLACLVSGPVLAIAVGLVGYVIHTPTIKLPMFDQMLTDRPTTILFALFVVAIGPLCEELAFRGFLMPLLMRSLGTAGGIVLTAVLFGAMHGYEYEWSWRHMLLISIVGVVLGWVRNDTGSTAASTFMHATFNLTQLAAFVAQPK
jgi:membrane protease YdiL (CAAX protease family)